MTYGLPTRHDLGQDLREEINKISILSGSGETKEKANKIDLDKHKTEATTQINNRIKKDGDSMSGSLNIKDQHISLLTTLELARLEDGILIITPIVAQPTTVPINLEIYCSSYQYINKIHLKFSPRDNEVFQSTSAIHVGIDAPEIKLGWINGKVAIHLKLASSFYNRVVINGYSRYFGALAVTDNWDYLLTDMPQEALGVVSVQYEEIPWISAIIQNGWTGSIRYRKNAIGQLELNISVSAGTITNGTIITTIPEQYRLNRSVPIHLYSTYLGRVLPAPFVLESGTGNLTIRGILTDTADTTRGCQNALSFNY